MILIPGALATANYSSRAGRVTLWTLAPSLTREGVVISWG